jgi:hypothetical protein
VSYLWHCYLFFLSNKLEITFVSREIKRLIKVLKSFRKLVIKSVILVSEGGEVFIYLFIN